MKKSLIALAVAGVFATPVAMAETTIYGAANVSFDVGNTGSGCDTTGCIKGGSVNQISSNASAIGFKGSEDLGGGTSAIWQIESGINLDSGGNTWAGNHSFAGLSGEGWGTLVLGNLQGPYKTAVRGFDLFADTIADNRNLTGPLDGTNQYGTLANAIAYISPNMGGFSVAVATVAGAETATGGTAGDITSEKKGSGYSLAAMYGAGPLNAAFAYQSVTVGGVSRPTLGNSTGLLDESVISTISLVGGVNQDDKLTSWTLGGSYAMDAFMVTLSYERGTVDWGSLSGGGSNERADWNLGGKYNISTSDAVKLAYTRANDMSGDSTHCPGLDCADTGATQISVGYDHGLSKNTTVYALYSQLNNKDNASYHMGGYDGITAWVPAATTGSDPHVFSIGMKHSF